MDGGNDQKEIRTHAGADPLDSTHIQPTRNRVRVVATTDEPLGHRKRCKDTARIGAKILIRVGVAASTVGYKIVFHKFDLETNS